MEQIRRAKQQDLSAIRALWEICFPSEGEFNDYFFREVFRVETVLLLCEGQRIRAMLQEIPLLLSVNGENSSSTYIYGACTVPAYRGQGCMARLLESSFKNDLELGRFASVLIPAESSLFQYYSKFNYEPYFGQVTQSFVVGNLIPASYTIRHADEEDWVRMNLIYLENQDNCYVVRDEKDWQAQRKMFQALNGDVFLLEKEGTCRGYGFVWEETKRIWVQELMCREMRENQIFAELLGQKFQKNHVTVTTNEKEKNQPFGVVKFYKEKPTGQPYLNLLWN